MNTNRRRFRCRASIPVGPRKLWAPRKGMLTQCTCVLLDAAPAVSDLVRTLDGFDVLHETQAAEGAQGWAFSGPSVIVAYRREVNGLVQVDIVDQPWPDSMGSISDSEGMLFGAWAIGHFGPCTFPGALERAVLHSYTWPEAHDVASRHRAFLRCRSSYVFGSNHDAPVRPENYDAIDELRFVSELQLALMALPGALAGFNPNGELLLPGERLERCLDRDAGGRGLAVDAWVNVRMFRPTDLGGDWLVYDSVGMGQLDVIDHEAVLPFHHASTEYVPGLIYSMAAYDAEKGGVLGPGDTATDSGGCNWHADVDGEALMIPQRTVLRWSPDDVFVPELLRTKV